jgi:hypothetical protein
MHKRDHHWQKTCHWEEHRWWVILKMDDATERNDLLKFNGYWLIQSHFEGLRLTVIFNDIFSLIESPPFNSLVYLSIWPMVFFIQLNPSIIQVQTHKLIGYDRQHSKLHKFKCLAFWDNISPSQVMTSLKIIHNNHCYVKLYYIFKVNMGDATWLSILVQIPCWPINLMRHWILDRTNDNWFNIKNDNDTYDDLAVRKNLFWC